MMPKCMVWVSHHGDKRNDDDGCGDGGKRDGRNTWPRLRLGYSKYEEDEDVDDEPLGFAINMATHSTVAAVCTSLRRRTKANSRW